MDGLVFIIMGGVVVYVVGYIIFNAGKSKQSNEDWINRLIKHYNSIYLTFIQVERLGPFEIDWCLIMESGSYFKIVFLPGGCASSVRQQNPDFTVAWEGSPGSVTEIEGYLKKRIEAKAVPLPLTPAAVSTAVSVVDVNNDTAESQPIAANKQIATAVPHREPVSNQLSPIDQRLRIGDFEFRDPDYRQILLWADALGFEPERVVAILASSSVDIVEKWILGYRNFTVEHGAIKALVWKFDQLPISNFQWVEGLVIDELVFDGKSTASLALELPTLKFLDCAATELSNLALGGVPSLERLKCSNNNLVRLDLSKVPQLTELWCCYNSLAHLDLSDLSLLSTLHCDHNKLTELDLPAQSALVSLYCNHNKLSELNLSSSHLLKKLDCGGNRLGKLDFSSCPLLDEVSCHHNQLTGLDLPGLSLLEKIECEENQIATLDLSGAPALADLHCSWNKISKLDLSYSPMLKVLSCCANQITEIELFHAPLLVDLDCGYNKISKLDFSKHPLLTGLGCSSNQIACLDITNLTMLGDLHCGGNHLTELDLFYNSKITILTCDDNELKSLDIRALENLQEFHCDDQIVLKKRPNQPFKAGVWDALDQNKASL